MKLEDVEPLSEERWQRIEDGVFRALDGTETPAERAAVRAARPRVPLFVAVSAGFALAAAALLALLPANTTPARERTIATDARALHIDFEQLSIDAAAHTVASLQGGDPKRVHATVQRGSLRFSLPREAERELEVNLADTRIHTVFARFVASYSNENATVAVDEGEVEVSRQGRTLILHAGERFPVPSPPATAAASDTATPAALAPDGAVGTPAALAPDGAVGTQGDAHASAAKIAPRPGRSPRENALLSPQERYERAARMEGTHPDEAAELYRALAQSQGGWAGNALFALGRLELERSQIQAARATLSQYLARYPRGRNAGDARRLLAQIR